MKKIYKNLIGVAFTAMFVSVAFTASAQRGGDHSDNKPSSGGGGSAPAPQQQSAPAPQPQRSNPQPQRNDNAQPQRNFNGGNNNAVSPPRNAPNNLSFGPPRSNNNGNNGQQRGNSFGGNPQRQFNGQGQRGNSLYPNRIGGSAYRGGGYRNYPGLQFGRIPRSPRPNGFYFHNRGSYRTYYTPQLGFRINVLPYGYYPFSFGANQYFYSDGLYYQQDNDDYTVVEPPIGAVITKLPAKAQAIAINGMQYYESNGVYYQPVTKDDGTLVYQIAGKDGELNTDDTGSPQDDLPQIGDLVDNLPPGCKTLKLNNQKYYVSEEGYYFQDAVDTNGDKVFKIVGTPTDEPDKQ